MFKVTTIAGILVFAAAVAISLPAQAAGTFNPYAAGVVDAEAGLQIQHADFEYGDLGLQQHELLTYVKGGKGKGRGGWYGKHNKHYAKAFKKYQKAYYKNYYRYGPAYASPYGAPYYGPTYASPYGGAYYGPAYASPYSSPYYGPQPGLPSNPYGQNYGYGSPYW